MPDDVRTALRGLDFFEGLPPDVFERLALVAHPFSLAAGEYLFREGDPGDRISVLGSGRLDTILRLPGGRELEVLPLEEGAMVGEMAVVAERPRRFSVRASEPSTGWSFDAADITRLGATDSPEVALRVGRMALMRLKDQYDRLGEMCAGDTRLSAPARPSAVFAAGLPALVEREPGETAYLETVLFFSRFTSDEIEQLFGDLRRIDAPLGATLISAGERSAPLLIVLRGAVETSIRRGGLAARARLAGPGRIVGHLSLLGDEPTPATARTREHSILLELPLGRVREIIVRDDELGRRFRQAVYADVVDALFEAQRPVARMAATGETD
jgi:CRP-like cAMP-binding protein